MSYLFNKMDAEAYEAPRIKSPSRFFTQLEIDLMLKLLNPHKGETVLDIGCGSGMNMTPLMEAGLHVTGIDPSGHMLELAREKFKHRAAIHCGYAEDLPFDDNEFHHACLFTTLEFVDDVDKAIGEAVRVTKDKLFIGILNRYAFKGLKRRTKGLFVKSIYNHARFFSIWEMKRRIKSIAGDVPIQWRTVCHFPQYAFRVLQWSEKRALVQWFPTGAFIGMVVTLVPTYKTRPLSLRCPAENISSALI